MGLRRYANKRDEAEPGIVAALEALGCLIYRLDKPVDLLVNHRGTIHLCEVKTRKGKLTADQQAFARFWPIRVLRTVEDAVALVGGRIAA